MYQFSTFTHIMQQHYEGRISIDSLQSRGNHGLGTFADLEGELVAIDGQYFQCVDFSCRLADASQLLAWAAVCDFVAPDIVDQTIQGTYLDNQFSAWNTQLNDKLAAIKIHGLMEKILLTSTAKQNKPYPTIPEVIEQSKQQEFHQLSGTLVGWYAPAMMNGIKSPGFHFHFVDDERHIGGHVLAFSVPEGHLSYQVMPGFTVEF